jgi:acyl-CoA thioesterase I
VKFRILVLLVCFYATSAQAKKIFMLGDSLTEGYGVSQLEAFPAIVEKSLNGQNAKVTIVNGGIGGSTSASGLGRLRWALKSKPDILFLCLGANDGLRGIKVSETRKNLEQILELAKKEKIPVVFAGMQLPFNYGETYRKEFAKMYVELNKKYKTTFIPFLLDGVAGNPKFNQTDGIHPNSEGHRMIAKLVEKTLLPLVNKK